MVVNLSGSVLYGSGTSVGGEFVVISSRTLQEHLSNSSIKKALWGTSNDYLEVICIVSIVSLSYFSKYAHPGRFAATLPAPDNDRMMNSRRHIYHIIPTDKRIKRQIYHQVTTNPPLFKRNVLKEKMGYFDPLIM